MACSCAMDFSVAESVAVDRGRDRDRVTKTSLYIYRCSGSISLRRIINSLSVGGWIWSI